VLLMAGWQSGYEPGRAGRSRTAKQRFGREPSGEAAGVLLMAGWQRGYEPGWAVVDREAKGFGREPSGEAAGGASDGRVAMGRAGRSWTAKQGF
jgi:hypothetical protein